MTELTVAVAPFRRSEVKLLRWPAESARRARYQALGVPRLLVLEGGVPAPVCSDVREDWVRPPMTEGDLRARIATLLAKAEAHRLPQLDPYGILRFGDRSITVSPSQIDLLDCLIRRFGSLVPRAALLQCLPSRPGAFSRNALDLHIMRLRRRIQPVDLVIRTVYRRGYLLEPLDDPQPVQGVRPRQLIEFPDPRARDRVTHLDTARVRHREGA
jgi:hypothetical protein